MRKFAILAAVLAAACGQPGGEAGDSAQGGDAGAPAEAAAAGPGWMPVELADLEGTPDHALRLDSPNGGLNVQEDFDGDGAADRAALVSDAAAGRYAVRVDTAAGRQFILAEGDIADLPRMGLSPAPAGTMQTACGKGLGDCAPDAPHTLTLAHPGFNLFTYESGARTFFWTGDGFDAVWTSD